MYNDSTNNQFKSDILWLDALLSPGMEALLYVFTKRLSLVIKYIVNRNNVDKEVQMNDVWHITLLDKKQIYRNKEAFPNFDYKTKEVSKRVGKVIKINDNKFEKFRNMVKNIIKIKDKNKGNFKTKFIFFILLTQNMKNYFNCKLCKR